MPGNEPAAATAGEFVPARLRERFTQLMVAVAFCLEREGKAQLRKVARQYALGRNNIALTPTSDEELALMVLERANDQFSVIIEFRKHQRSPYRRASASAMTAVVDVIRNYGRDLRLVQWGSHVSRPSDGPTPPTAPVTLGGRQVTIAGLKLRVEPDVAAAQPGGTVLIDWSETGALVIEATTRAPVASLSEAIERGATLFADILESFGSEQTAERTST